MFRDFLKHLGISSSLSTAFHLQTDGGTKQVNQKIEAYLFIFCTTNPEIWNTSLPILQFVHNSHQHADRTCTPFELIMGTQPRALPEAFDPSPFLNKEDQLKDLDHI